MTRRLWRRAVSGTMVALMGAAVGLAVLPLAVILGTLVAKGVASLNLDFFLRPPAPVGEPGGGVAHAIVGTLLLVGAAAAMGLPIGIAAGIYCAEFGGTRLAKITRFLADVLNGTPSIVVGVFAWTLIVARQGGFSGFAGSVALAVLLVPMVLRTTEELVRLVPNTLREAALALGYPRWRTTLAVVVRTTLPGIVTGMLLAVARVAGETAPLLFTTLGSPYLNTDLSAPMAALPLAVYVFATGPYEEWHRLAWGAALVLILVVLVLSLLARLSTRQRFDRRD